MENNNTGRNSADMIMELLALHVKLAHNEGNPVNSEKIEELYKKYRKVVVGK